MARASTSYQPRPNWRGNAKGGPIKVLNKAAYDLVTKLASLDKAESTIFNALGISGPCWYAMKKRDPKLLAALEHGRGLARDTYVAALQRHGKRSFIPHIFMLKSLHGLTEGAPPESQQPNIVINLPSAQSLANYVPPKLIEHDDG